MSEQNYANVQQQAELMKYISDNMKIPVLGAGGGFAPIGTINFFDASVAPEGWLACDGTTYNIADYPDLATYYASVHGSSNFYGGNGTTTFAVPDLRGEFLRGSGTNSHANQGSGANVGVHQDSSYLLDNWANNQYAGIYYPASPDSSYQSSIGNVDKKFVVGKRLSVQAANPLITPSSTTNDIYADNVCPTNTSFLICVKATVSGDANAHQYSTEEQVVGKWIDESNIYEKTVIGLSKQTTWASQYSAAFSITDSELGISSGNIERILSGNCYAEYKGENLAYTISNMTTNPTTHTHILAIHDSVVVTGVTIQYTKTQ